MLKITPQHDLKGRTPERSEWLLAGGAAKRSPRYHDAHHNAFEERENRLPWQLISRPPDAFLRGAGIPGVALTLNPRLKALGLKPSAFNLSGWIPPNATRQYKTQIITNMALINTIMLCKSA